MQGCGHEGRGWSGSEGPFLHAGQRCWWLVTKTGMRADMVVMVPPLLKQNLRFFQRVESLAVQVFIPQAAIEALVIAVLPWATRLNIKGFDPQLGQPALD